MSEKKGKAKELLIPTEYSERFYAIMDTVWNYDDDTWRKFWTELMENMESLVK